jgi:hypothetical protein
MTEAINIVLNGPPGHDGSEFVEAELDNGESVNVGEWIQRGNYWVLRITSLPVKEKGEDDRNSHDVK